MALRNLEEEVSVPPAGETGAKEGLEGSLEGETGALEGLGGALRGSTSLRGTRSKGKSPRKVPMIAWIGPGKSPFRILRRSRGQRDGLLPPAAVLPTCLIRMEISKKDVHHAAAAGRRYTGSSAPPLAAKSP
jgi:hypothetical protein